MRLLVLVVTLVTIGGSAQAAPVLVDQSNLVGLQDYPLSSTNFGTLDLAQSFTPDFSSLDVVELVFNTNNIPGAPVLRVDILAGGIDGPVIGSSADVTILGDQAMIPPVQLDDLTQFLFDTPVALTPGSLYVIDLVHVSGTNGYWLNSGVDAYAGGTAFRNGSARSEDFTFRTGLVPEPSVAVLVSFAAGVMAMRHRSRTRH